MTQPAVDFDLGEYVYAGHYALLHHTLRQAKMLYPTRIALEFGVGSGQSTRMIAEQMRVVGFDSFEGLPEDWREGYPAGSFTQNGQPPAMASPHGVSYQIGRFEDTVPGALGANAARVGLIHIDCDLYSSTKTVLDHAQFIIDRDRPYIVFDEFHGYDGAERHEQRAWWEFVERTGVEWTVVGHSHEQWSICVI